MVDRELVLRLTTGNDTSYCADAAQYKVEKLAVYDSFLLICWHDCSEHA